MTPPPLPESLAGPVLETAVSVLRALEPTAVPGALRPLLRFDRRKLVHGPAARQLLRCIEHDAAFEAAVVEAAAGDAAGAALVDGVDEHSVVDRTFEAAARDDLAAFACALWVHRPPGHELGIGAAAAIARLGEARLAEQADAAEARRRVDIAQEAARRAEAARDAALADLAQLTEARRDERASVRDDIARERSRREEAERRVETLDAELATARRLAADAQAAAAREAERARRAEQRRAEEASRRPVVAGLDDDTRDELRRAAAEARRFAARLDAIEAGASLPVRGGPGRDQRGEPSERPAPRAPRDRRRPDLPGGLVADTPEALAAMLRTPGLHLVVDGYNVSNRAWPGRSPADQREHLLRALDRVHLALGPTITVVFDGDGTPPRAQRARPGVRVVFSSPDEEADDVVVRTVQGLGRPVPVVVASSDAWVREHAGAHGAVPVSAPTLVDVWRTARS